MSQTNDATHTEGPALPDAVHEVQGHFQNDATLQDAIARLALLGFDRADLSLPPSESIVPSPDSAEAVPTPLDATQMRTMNSGMTGAAVGVGLAAVLASGGVAAPVVIAAAALGAFGASAATTGASLLSDHASAAARDALGAAGKLVLAARIHRVEQVGPATQALHEAGAQKIVSVRRVEDAATRGVSAASWTG